MAVETRSETAPASSHPMIALLVGSSCVTILLCALTEHFAEAAAALVAYAVAWGFLRRA